MGLLKVDIKPRRQPVTSDPMMDAVSNIGGQLITDAMRTSRQELLNKYKDKVRGEGYAREDASDKIKTERYNQEQAYAAQDRADTKQYRSDALAQTGQYQADTLAQRKAESQAGLLQPDKYITKQGTNEQYYINKGGELVPVIESRPGIISSNEQAFNAPLDDTSQMGQFGYEDATSVPFKVTPSAGKIDPRLKLRIDNNNSQIEILSNKLRPTQNDIETIEELQLENNKLTRLTRGGSGSLADLNASLISGPQTGTAQPDIAQPVKSKVIPPPKRKAETSNISYRRERNKAKKEKEDAKAITLILDRAMPAKKGLKRSSEIYKNMEKLEKAVSEGLLTGNDLMDAKDYIERANQKLKQW